MDDALGANVAELIRALQGKGIPLPHEVGTFIAWEVCCALKDAPRAVTGEQVFINKQGQVAVAEASAVRLAEAATAVVHLLGELLVASAPGVPEPVLALVESAQSRGLSLSALCDELEAALVPLNRSATMRILGRLARDAFGPRKSRVLPGAVRPEAEVTADIDSLLGVDSAAADSIRQEQVEARKEAHEDAQVSTGDLPPRSTGAVAVSPVSQGRAASPQFSAQLSADVNRLSESGGRRPLWLLAGLVFVLIVAGVAYAVSRSKASRVELAAPPHDRAVLVTTVSPRTTSERVVAFDSMPRGAQVFVQVADGGGSVRVERGVAHEFLFRDLGGSAHRVHIAADAQYDENGAEASLAIDVAKWRGAGIGDSQLPVERRTKSAGDVTRLVRLDFQHLQGAMLYRFVATTPALLEGVPAKTAAVLYYRRGFELKTSSVQLSASASPGVTRVHVTLDKSTGA